MIMKTSSNCKRAQQCYERERGRRGGRGKRDTHRAVGGRENGEGAGEADCNCGDTKTSVKHTQKCIETQIAMKSKIKQESATKRERLSK